METDITFNAGEQPQKESGVLTPSNLIDGRPCKEILLPITQQKVYMAEYLSVGEDEDASAALMENVIVKKESEIPFTNTTSYTHAQVRAAVKKIVDATGKEIVFSLEWYRNLPKPDLSIIKKFILDNYRDLLDEEGNKKK